MKYFGTCSDWDAKSPASVDGDRAPDCMSWES